MTRSIKPTLIFLGSIGGVGVLLAWAYLYFTDSLTLVNMALSVLIVPVGFLLLVLTNRNEGDVKAMMSGLDQPKDASNEDAEPRHHDK